MKEAILTKVYDHMNSGMSYILQHGLQLASHEIAEKPIVHLRHLLLSFGHAGVAVLNDVELDAVALWQGNPRLSALTNYKYVGQTCSEAVSNRILAMHDLKAAWMPLPTHNGSNSAHVITTADHDSVANIKLHVVDDFVGCDIDTNSIIRLDVRVWRRSF